MPTPLHDLSEEEKKRVEAEVSKAETTYPCPHVAQNVIASCPSCELAIAWGRIEWLNIELEKARMHINHALLGHVCGFVVCPSKDFIENAPPTPKEWERMSHRED
jgi:hypothetical protein